MSSPCMLHWPDDSKGDKGGQSGEIVQLCIQAARHHSPTHTIHHSFQASIPLGITNPSLLTFLIVRRLGRVSTAAAARGGLQTTKGPSRLVVLLGILLPLDRKDECHEDDKEKGRQSCRRGVHAFTRGCLCCAGGGRRVP